MWFFMLLFWGSAVHSWICYHDSIQNWKLFIVKTHYCNLNNILWFQPFNNFSNKLINYFASCVTSAWSVHAYWISIWYIDSRLLIVMLLIIIIPEIQDFWFVGFPIHYVVQLHLFSKVLFEFQNPFVLSHLFHIISTLQLQHSKDKVTKKSRKNIIAILWETSNLSDKNFWHLVIEKWSCWLQTLRWQPSKKPLHLMLTFYVLECISVQ